MNNYPDDVSQASFDRYWNELLDDGEPPEPADPFWGEVDDAYAEWKDER